MSNRPLPARLSYTLTDATVATGLSAATLRRHEKNGLLRFFKVGGRTLVCAQSLRKLITGDHALPRSRNIRAAAAPTSDKNA